MRQRLKNLDYYLFVPYILLCLIGIVMVFSASADIAVQNGGSPIGYLIKQSMYVLVGFFVLMFVVAMNLETLRHSGFLKSTAWVVLGLLVFVLIFARSVNGAKGWINLKVISIQPAEAFKLFLIIYLAHYLAKYRKIYGQRARESIHYPELLRMYFVIGTGLVLILLQPDTGGFAINFSILFVMFCASGVNWKWGVGFMLSGLAFLTILLGPVAKLLAKHLSSGSYQIQRFIAFANPFGHAQGSGSQLVNSYYAIAHGGLFGVGLGNGVQKMGYLPEPNTDFILAVIAEEMGALFVIFLLALLTIIVARTVWIGVRCRSQYQALICYGVATFITIETFFNVGGVVGLLPITGVTFPFISYGGSSMLVLCASLGLVINISSQQRRVKVVK